MRKTKMICTIGPACEDEQTLKELMLAGMNVARLNFSHGTHEWHSEIIRRIKKIRAELGIPVAIMLDTKGPEYRIRQFANGKVTLHDGDRFTFTTQPCLGDETHVSVNYPGLARDLEVGDRILLSNGILIFRVEELTESEVHCTVTAGGELSDNKSMCFPGKVLNSVYLSEQDRSDILLGIENSVDFIACSFVSRKQDLLDIHAFLEENGGEGIDLIAKIENQSGIDNIEEICDACDGIMIGRGDMGVELPFEELPGIQKQLITKCRLLGKRVITATEMLESMIEKPRPTRAETSDVANAVYDGTSAVMLSGETAAGKYPVLAASTMARICESTECDIDYKERFRSNKFNINSTVDAISHATCGMAIDVDARAIAVCTLSGVTARMVSRFRSPVDIMAITTNEKSWYKLALSWGVTPVMSETYESLDVLFYTAKNLCKNGFSLSRGDKIIITGGMTNGISGNTNIIKIETV